MTIQRRMIAVFGHRCTETGLRDGPALWFGLTTMAWVGHLWIVSAAPRTLDPELWSRLFFSTRVLFLGPALLYVLALTGDSASRRTPLSCGFARRKSGSMRDSLIFNWLGRDRRFTPASKNAARITGPKIGSDITPAINSRPLGFCSIGSIATPSMRASGRILLTVAMVSC